MLKLYSPVVTVCRQTRLGDRIVSLSPVHRFGRVYQRPYAVQTRNLENLNDLFMAAETAMH